MKGEATTYSSVGLTRLRRVCLGLGDLLWARRLLGDRLCGCGLFGFLNLLNGSGLLRRSLLCLSGG